MTQVSANSKAQPNWGMQLSKSIGLAITSVGLGCAIQRMWKGPESSQIPCSVSLSIGGAGSLLTSNPLPLVAASSLCLPAAAARSVVPHDDTYLYRIRDGVKIFNSGLWTTIGGFAGAFGGPPGAAGGALLGYGAAEGINRILDLAPLGNSAYGSLTLNLEAERNRIATDPKYESNSQQLFLEYNQQLFKDIWHSNIAEKPKHEKAVMVEMLSNTQKVLEKEIQAREALTNLVGQNEQTFKRAIGDLNQKYRACNNQIKTLLNGVNNNAQDIQNLAKATADSFENLSNQLNAKIDKTDALAQQTAGLTNHLVEQAMIISTQGFESSKKILGLEKEMHDLQSKGDLNGALGKVTALKKAIQEEQNNRVKFDQNLDGIASGIGMLSLVAKLSGDPKMANMISTIGQSAVTIAKSIGALAGLGSAAASIAGGFAVLGPIGAIGGAIGAIFSLFSSNDPPPEQQILEAISALSKQLNQVRKEMHERFDRLEKRMDMRFDRLEKMLQDHHHYVGARFDHLLKVMNQLHKQTIEKFLEVKADANQIKRLADSIKTTVDQMVQTMMQIAALGELTEYRKLCDSLGLKYHEQYPLPDNEMPQQMQREYFDKFVYWARMGMVNELFTGALGHVAFEDVAKAVKKQGTSYTIQLLANLASEQLQFQKIGNLPNPLLWPVAVDSFLEFLWRTPEFKPTFHQKVIFKQIRDRGARFQSLVLGLQSSPETYQILFNHYRHALKIVQQIIKDLVIKTIRQSDEAFDEDKLKATAHSVLPQSLTDRSAAVKKEGLELLAQVKGNYTDRIIHGLTLLPSKLSGISPTQKIRYYDMDLSRYETLLHVLLPPHYATGDAAIANKHVALIEKKLSEAKLPQQVLQRAAKAGQNSNLVVPKAYLERLKAFHDEIPIGLANHKQEFQQFLTDFETDLIQWDAHLKKYAEIETSQEQAYLEAQRALKVFGQLLPQVRKIAGMEQRLIEQMKYPQKIDETYHYLLHHLTDKEREAVKATLYNEVVQETSASPLNLALRQVENFHVLLEAYIRLGFQQEFSQDYDFRMLFENLWSAEEVRNSILKWNTNNPEEMPYIQIADQALPRVKDLRMGLFDKITQHGVARNTGLEISKQKTGHPEVDAAQKALHLYEALFLKEEKPAGKDEL